LLQADVTAIVAFDDLVAQGIMAGLADRGLQVPRDMSVVGFDDVLAARTYPPLTTVAAHCAEAGSQAVALLSEILQSGRCPIERVVIPTKLVIRATTSRPNITARRRAAGGKPLAAAS
jgi:LacI family transcriptional regulator